MATSTVIQFLDAGETSSTSNRSQEETFLAGGAIVKGDWVALDLSQTGADKALYVVQAPATAGSPIPCGVALEAASSGGQVRVCIGGYAASANVTTGTAPGLALMMTSTAGRTTAATYIGNGSGAASLPLPVIIGTCLTRAAANVAEVWVIKRF